MTDWKVPLSDIDLGADEIEAVTEVIRRRWLTMGPKTEEFEYEFARHHHAKHAVAVSSGTAALHLSYLAIGLSPGDEVIMPSMTFVATANAAIVCGARPIFADILSEGEPTIDPDHVESLITPRSRAIVVVHYAGYSCRMKEIMRVAEKHSLPVLEDCAHAPGVRYDDRYLGTLGTTGCFSFFSNKNLSTGEGGMVTTQDDEIAERVRLLRSHGMTSGTWKRHNERPQDYDVSEAGWNYRIDEIRAAMGLVQLAKLEQANVRRIELNSRYRSALQKAKAARMPFQKYRGESACHILPLVATNHLSRQQLVGALTQARVQSSHHYAPVHLFRLYREKFGYGPGLLPRTESFAAREITLPLFARMLDVDVDYVADVINAI
ncbi:MAG: DegT/DnrJ/EryC1/StrS family aminotransferase [Acidobacteriota bacterium]